MEVFKSELEIYLLLEAEGDIQLTYNELSQVCDNGFIDSPIQPETEGFVLNKRYLKLMDVSRAGNQLKKNQENSLLNSLLPSVLN